MSSKNLPQRFKLPANSLPPSVVKQRAINPSNVAVWIDPDQRPFVPTTQHYHWTIQAFEWMDEESGEMHDTVTIVVEAKNEEEAKYAAMQAIYRPAYRITHVGEACSLDKELKSGK